MNNKEKLNIFWKEFLKNTGRDKNVSYMESFYFGSNEASANDLLKLVLDRKKRATCSSLFYFEYNNLPTPKIGDLCVVTDWEGIPYGVIKTVSVFLCSFEEVTFAQAVKEGENSSLEEWREDHEYYFRYEANKIGYTFTADMPVVFEEFELIYTAENG